MERRELVTSSASRKGNHMKYRIIGVLAIVVVVFTAMTGIVLADEPPDEDSANGYWLTEYEGSQLQQEDLARIESGEVVLMDESTALNGCDYDTGGDDPHQSGGDVSAHGWWEKNNDECPSRADVAAWLQAAWCTDFGCQWVTLDFDQDRIRPGPGRGRRVTVRNECHSNEWTYYRNMVDVDIPGTIDPPDRVYKVKQVQCRPPGPGYGD